MNIPALFSVFLPVVMAGIVFTFHPVGTVWHHQSFGHDYEVTMIQAAVLDETGANERYVVTTYRVTNNHRDPLVVGPGNFVAYDATNNIKLTYRVCLDELSEFIPQGQTGTGSLCWSGQKGTRVVVFYRHSIFTGNEFAWEFYDSTLTIDD